MEEGRSSDGTKEGTPDLAFRSAHNEEFLDILVNVMFDGIDDERVEPVNKRVEIGPIWIIYQTLEHC